MNIDWFLLKILSKLNTAFFTMNGVLSVVMFTFTFIDLVVSKLMRGTGSSGLQEQVELFMGLSLCQYMLLMGKTVHLIITDAGWRVLHDELDWEVSRRQETLEEHFGGSAWSTMLSSRFRYWC